LSVLARVSVPVPLVNPPLMTRVTPDVPVPEITPLKVTVPLR